MTIARYSVTFGLAGCYLPDSHYGAFECRTRRELADTIRHALECYDLPKTLFGEVGIVKLWSRKKFPSFGIRHGANVLEFHAMTRDEYREYVRQEEEEDQREYGPQPHGL